MLFRAGTTTYEEPVESYFIHFNMKDEIETTAGWKKFTELKVGDTIIDGVETSKITSINRNSVAEGIATIYFDESEVVV